jgi:LmbE family N-acetylglucosaminyl deacetylase
MKKILVISAHPDDETLGCGGTLLKHKSKGDEIYWIIVTDVFVEDGFTNERVESRKKEIDKVAKMYGFSKVFNLGFSTSRLENTILGQLIKKISQVFNEVTPEILYTLNRSDAHSDHRIIAEAVFACTKSFRYPYIKQVLMYECLSETEFAPALYEKVFLPNYFVDISDFIDSKVKIMSVFESELSLPPFPRSIENIKALATLRGSMVGVRYAESFQLLKFIDK